MKSVLMNKRGKFMVAGKMSLAFRHRNKHTGENDRHNKTDRLTY